MSQSARRKQERLQRNLLSSQQFVISKLQSRWPACLVDGTYAGEWQIMQTTGL